MMRSPSIALVFLSCLGPSSVLAQDTAGDREWTSWRLTAVAGATDHVAGWQLAFHPDGRASTSWVGPMYESEAGDELATLEGLEGIGTYEKTDDKVVFRNDDISDGWLWRWNTVTCAIKETATDLSLTRCHGAGRPDWANEDPAPPEDMTFVRLP